MKRIVETLRGQRHRDSTRRSYYAIWKVFNKFIVKLDCKPDAWEDCLTLFVGHLVQSNKKASTVKSYISAIRSVLQDVKVELHEDRMLMTSLTKACRLRNDGISIRLPIQKSLLCIILKQLRKIYATQPYLRDLYSALFSTAYFGLFRVGELTKGEHPVLARDIHIGRNKKKMLFILRTSKTHWKNDKPQIIKISSSSLKLSRRLRTDTGLELPCPFKLLRRFLARRGPCRRRSEPFFIFKDRQPVKPTQFRECLKLCLKRGGFNQRNYNTHSLRLGRSCDLYKLGLSIEKIKKLGRWRTNVVFKYLRV